ncbi:MAG TPA: hypothetical protein VFC56_16155 [Stellaceae bacterium]|nr:hypothetical protein [Stellaceae bacterium]
MRSRLPIYLLALVTLFACDCGPLRATTYCLSFKKLGLSPGERLFKFDLHITSGIVVGLPHVPLDWQIVIDNEANWMPEVSGNAIHETADLEEREFETDFIRLDSIPHYLVKSGMPKNMAVTGSMELSDGTAKRVLTLSDRNIALAPRHGCGRN